MNRIEWDESFAVGLREIDDHHRHLVQLLASIHDDFLEGVADLEPKLQALADYANYHFRSEELWMMQGLYPELMHHKKEHDSFRTRISTMQKAYTRGRQYFSIEMIVFLEGWIVDHILIMDFGLGKHLLERK